MNKLIALVLILGSSSAFASNFYKCSGGSEPLEIEVTSPTTLIINGTDKAEVDLENAAKNPNKKSYSLIGNFESLGDGAEGYNVEVYATKYLFNGSKMAYVNTYVSGPDGFYSDSYQCFKQ